MADSDYSVIKPVESLQTIQGIAPAKRRQERKQRQNAPHEHPEKTETEAETEAQRNEAEPTETVHDEDDPHSIDYRA